MKIIVDVGMHVGQDTELYLLQGYKVIAIEANPIEVDKCKVKFKSYIDNGLLQILNVGVGGKTKDNMTFYLNKMFSHWSTFKKELATSRGDFEEINIKCYAFGELMNFLAIDPGDEIEYVKIDIEGYDFMALQSLLNDSKYRPKYISIENGAVKILNFLRSKGYSSYRYVNQLPLSGKNVKVTTTNGNKIDFLLQNGASGPFGEDLEDKYLNYEEVKKEITKVWQEDGKKNAKHVDAVDGWFDLHAKFEG